MPFYLPLLPPATRRSTQSKPLVRGANGGGTILRLPDRAGCKALCVMVFGGGRRGLYFRLNMYRYPYRTPTPCPARAVTGVCVVVLAVAVYYTAFFGLWGFGGVGSRRASGMASGDRGGAVAGEIEMQRWGGGRDLYRYLRPPTPGVCRKLILTRLHYYRTP